MSSDDEQDPHHTNQSDNSDHEDDDCSPRSKSKSPPAKAHVSMRSDAILSSMKQASGYSGSLALEKLVKKAKNEAVSTKNRSAPSQGLGHSSGKQKGKKGKGKASKPSSGRPADTVFRAGAILMLHEGTEVDESGIIPHRRLVNDSVPSRARVSELLQLKLAAQADEYSGGFSIPRESTADDVFALITSVLPEPMEYFQILEAKPNPAFNNARDPEIQRHLAPFVLVSCENRHSSIPGEVNYPTGQQIMHYSKSKTNTGWWNNTIILAARYKIPVNVIRGWLPASTISQSKRKSSELEPESEAEPEKDEPKALRRSKRIKVESQVEENETNDDEVIIIDDSDHDDSSYSPQSALSMSTWSSHPTRAATPPSETNPSTSSNEQHSLQYATSIFEGMKAHLDADGKPRLFRPELNMARFARSADRVALPPFNQQALLELIKRLIQVEYRWLLPIPEHCLYIRPTMIGTRSALAISASESAKIYVLVTPVGPYFRQPRAISVLASEKNPGDTGHHKLAANYSPTFVHLRTAIDRGYEVALWLLGDTIMEVGAMNIFFVVQRDDGGLDIFTPSLDGTVLPGVTRQSCLDLVRGHSTGSLVLPGFSSSNKIYAHEEKLTMSQVVNWHKDGKLLEAFGVGTAVLVAPIGRIGFNGEDLNLASHEGIYGPVSQALRRRILEIQQGKVDWQNWSVVCQ
ncbi:aminotransferase [Mycena floridula]|nr:aminotransferase [Mycena floridula]